MASYAGDAGNIASFGRLGREALGLDRSLVVLLHGFFFGLALLLGEAFALAGLACLAVLHPQVLHIMARFQEEPEVNVVAPRHGTSAPWFPIVDRDPSKSTDWIAIAMVVMCRLVRQYKVLPEQRRLLV